MNITFDTIVFCEVELGEIVNVKRVLIAFEKLSELKVNFRKLRQTLVNGTKERCEEMA